MKKIEPIQGISKEIKAIRAKLDINARDWNKDEKEAIAKVYFEITKSSTLGGTGAVMNSLADKNKPKGRVLDTGCDSCVNTAVNIIKNYLAAIGQPVATRVIKPASKSVPKLEPIPAPVSDNPDDNLDSDDNTSEENSDDDLLFAPKNKNWRKNLDSINTAAKEFDFTFSEKATTKKDKIAELEKHLKKINE